jgi:hypothetical protein
MTSDGFNFVPKPMPIGLMGTHGWPKVAKSNQNKLAYIYICMYVCVHNLKRKNDIHVYFHYLKHMHGTLM